MENLLNFDSLKTVTFSDFVNDQAEAIYEALKGKYYIIPRGKDKNDFYFLQPNLTYEIYSSDVKNKLLSVVCKLIAKSFTSLTKEKQNELSKPNIADDDDDDGECKKKKVKYIKPKIFSNAFVEKFYPQLVVLLTDSKITFDTYTNEIHFNNGFINLKTLEFKQRELGKDYITKYNERDYKPSTKQQQNLILSHIVKTYPIKEDLKSILLILGSCLSGESCADQDILFLLGEGSVGKSNILALTQACMPCYFQELQSDTFAESNSKIDKILMTFQKNPQIRISWINELKDTRINAELFKDFVDGSIKATALFKDGQNTFKHFSKAIITANTMPNIKIDTGVTRRFKGYTHHSKFVSDPALVDEKKHVYLGNKFFIRDITANNLLDAWFDILAEYCAKWNNGEAIIYSKNFQETKDEVMNSNDIFLDFVDSRLTMTGEPTDRIGKNKMHEEFSNMYPNKKLTVLQIITSLKEKKITYDGKLRCDSIQGCFFGVKFKSCKPSTPDDDDDDDSHIDYKAEYNTQCDIYKELQDKYNQLQREIKTLKTKLKNNEI
jgi:hypothetical protein